MTDIRKDFEDWFATQYPDPVPDYAAHEARVFKDNQFTAYKAGRAHGVDELIAEMHQYVNSIPIGRYNPTKGDSAYNWGKHFLAEFSEIIRKPFGKE